MNLYRVILLVDDIVMHDDYLHAFSESGVESRIKSELKNKFFDRCVIEQIFCKCGSDEDVANYWIGDQMYIECRDCRFDHVKRVK